MSATKGWIAALAKGGDGAVPGHEGDLIAQGEEPLSDAFNQRVVIAPSVRPIDP